MATKHSKVELCTVYRFPI